MHDTRTHLPAPNDPPGADVDLSLVIAVYNEADNVEPLLTRLDAVLPGLGCTYEILIVDDCSTDDTRQRLRGLVGRIAGLNVIELVGNVGQVMAVNAALSVARGRWILMMDGDLQHAPEDIPQFWQAKADFPKADLVASYRKERSDILLRKFVTFAFNRINRLITGVSIRDFGSSFRLIQARIINTLRDKDGIVWYNTPKIFIAAKKYVEIPVVHHARFSGKSKWTLFAFVMFNMDFLVASKKTPQFFIMISIAAVIVGVLLYGVSILGLSSAGAMTAPMSIMLNALIIVLLSIIWREIVNIKDLMQGFSRFSIERITTVSTHKEPS